jgi:hypothetical protein
VSAAPEQPSSVHPNLSFIDRAPHVAALRPLAELAGPDKEQILSGFKDPEDREDCEEWLENGLIPRLTRYQEQLDSGAIQDAENFQRHWIDPDFVTALNKLAQYHSQLCRDAFFNHAPAEDAAKMLADTLYERLGSACAEMQWFILDEIQPFVTPFDPVDHMAAGPSEYIEGCKSNLIITVREIGRTAVDGALLQRSKVIISQ